MSSWYVSAVISAAMGAAKDEGTTRGNWSSTSNNQDAGQREPRARELGHAGVDAKCAQESQKLPVVCSACDARANHFRDRLAFIRPMTKPENAK